MSNSINLNTTKFFRTSSTQTQLPNTSKLQSPKGQSRVANVEGQLKQTSYNASSNEAQQINNKNTTIALAGRKELPLFVKGAGDNDAVSINDIRQGNYNDCFYLASIAAVAQNSPQNIRNMIKPTSKYGEDGYMVSFKGGTRTFISKAEVQAEVNEGTGAKLGDGGETWVKVLELALKKVVGASPRLNTDNDDFSKGGLASEALPLLTGRQAGNVSRDNMNASHMEAQLRSGALMTAASDGSRESTQEAKKYGIAINTDSNGKESNFWHEYAVKNVKRGKDGKYYVSLFNPWGEGKSPAPIPIEDFKKIFARITVT